jgi:hypothetical protein
MIGLVIIVLMGLIPHWKATIQGTTILRGYFVIFKPPDPLSYINSSRLLVQWLGVCIVVAGVVLILKDKDEK